jgi:hypothetical protein
VNGNFLYVALAGTVNANNKIVVFSIDQNSGSLTPISGSPFTTGNDPLYMTLVPVITVGSDGGTLVCDLSRVLNALRQEKWRIAVRGNLVTRVKAKRADCILTLQTPISPLPSSRPTTITTVWAIACNRPSITPPPSIFPFRCSPRLPSSDEGN